MTTTARRARPALVVAATTTVFLLAVTACSDDVEQAPARTSASATKAGTPRVSIQECQEVPAQGRVYRSGSDLRFTHGTMTVALPKNRSARPAPPPSPAQPPPGAPGGAPVPAPAPPPNVLPTPAPAPAPQYVPPPQQYVPPPQQYYPAPAYPPAHHRHPITGPHHRNRVAPVTNAPPAPAPTAPTPATDDIECVTFGKCGNASPEVPLDSLLFTFRGAGTDGGQISFAGVALAGGTLPPLGPNQPPRVGPLHETIPADIGVSLGGKYYLASGCPLKLVAMGPKRAAGVFSCPNAIPLRENPLAPNDAAPNPDDEGDDGETATHAAPAPGQPAPPPAPAQPAGPPPAPAPNPEAITISGWFQVKP